MGASTGAATASVDRLSLRMRTPSGEYVQRHVVRKRLQPLTSGRHAEASRVPDHWAYWRREALANASGLLPAGPGLAAPRLLDVDGDTIYTGEPEQAEVAAERLGQWQARAPVPDEPWLARHQLAQRIAVTRLDWTGLDADPRLIALWDRRHELLEELEELPVTVVHGDYSAGNLYAVGEDTTFAIDWATFGVGPIGADLASLTLSTGADHLDDYISGLDGAYSRDVVGHGYRVALGLTHASRTHWALAQGRPVDSAMTDLVLGITS
ncbi:phosphotransferase [Pseudactinotalea terrae]|uniref:phosphotransferase n=1 Tax=Pseudactinotalea terrae TaxID=1743262 RepID=UPI0019D54CCF|nr:phosphotransferase [Pseudactinotalea terrae]